MTWAGRFGSRALSAATKLNDLPLGYCNGHRPWLGPNAAQRCGGSAGPVHPNRLLVRAASNAYFAQTLSVISIPESGAKVRAAVDEVWEDFLQYSDSLEDVVRDRRRQKVSAALEGLSNEEVWQEVQRRKGGPAPTAVGIREAEIKTLVVDPDQRGRGLGRIIVEALLNEARAISLRTVFALTTTPVFFESLGFQQAAVSAFPRKVWNECLRCPKYDRCDEVALAIDLANPAADA